MRTHEHLPLHLEMPLKRRKLPREIEDLLLQLLHDGPMLVAAPGQLDTNTAILLFDEGWVQIAHDRVDRLFRVSHG